MKVPYLNLVQSNKDYKKEILSKMADIMDESLFVSGPEVEKFEKEISHRLKCRHTISVNSGTDALFLTLKCLNIGVNDEIITVANSFIATTNSIRLVGAKEVFVDIKENGLIDENQIKKVITEKTKAIIPVHLTGKPCNMDVINKLCLDNNLYLVEDCAQAIGAKWNGKYVGTYGVGAFSLHPLKNLSGCGDGGFITTNDDILNEKLRKLRNHGLIDRNQIEFPGYNSRLDAIHAGVLNIKLKYLTQVTEKRRNNAKLYSRFFEKKNMSEVKFVPNDNNNEYSVYHTFVIRVSQRNKLQEYLLKNNIESKIHYPIPIHLQKPYKNNIKLEETEKYVNEILSLPINEHLSSKQIRYVVDIINKFYLNNKLA